MNEWIANVSSLPNLHPALVHFPLALLPLAVVTDAVLCWRRRGADTWVAVLYGLAAVAALIAYRAGEAAEHSLARIPAGAQLTIGRHHDLALYTLWCLGSLAVLRLLVAWRDRRRQVLGRLPLRLLCLVIGVGGIGLLAKTADLGGALVFEHGLGVRAVNVSPPAEAGEPSTPALPAFKDGTLAWRPTPADGVLFQQLLVPVEGSAASVHPVEARGPGLVLAISGLSILRLNDDVGDVQLEAEFEFEDFVGRLGLLSNVEGSASGAAFVLSAGGRVELVQLGESEKVLDSAQVDAPRGRSVLTASSAGRHLKGLVDGELVCHGHASSLAGGGVGLMFDGTGIVRLHRFEVIQLSESNSDDTS